MTIKTPTLKEDLETVRKSIVAWNSVHRQLMTTAALKRIEQALADLPHLEEGIRLLTQIAESGDGNDVRAWRRAERARLARQKETG